MTVSGMLRWVAIAGLAAALVGGCASSKSGDGADAAGADAMVDGPPDPCDGVACPGLTYCKEGTCVPFPDCPVDGGMPGPDPVPSCPDGTTCRNSVCIPDGLDIDHDGYPAATDCDEQNPDIHPDASEACNGFDDNCVDGIDEGDPVLLCEGNGAGNICMGGACVCADGNFDLDPTIPGCECVAAPPVGAGLTCATAIVVGDLSDAGAGQLMNVSGNIPNGRQVWYRFRAVDTADTACDNYHAAAKLMTNPDDQFRIRMFRGDCASPIEVGQFTEVEWATDLRQDLAGRLTGQCPCWIGTPVDNVSQCSDDSADYYVAVERVAGGTDTCASYSLEVSNGVYDWQ
ncbi:MAG: putative metal-binding motif-containing protein [Kofleriaceae bacterium]